MAKNDNLKDFLTDVADAIREKKGTTEKINPQDFSDEIKSIGSVIVNKDIHIDANGTYEIKADTGTAMTQVNVEVEVPTGVFQETMIDNTGKGVVGIKKLFFSDGVTDIYAYSYQRAGCTHVYIPDSLVKIGISAFHTSKLTYISPMPPNLNYIGQQAFAYTLLRVLDCRRCVSIPTLGGTAAFSGTLGTIIVVPDALYDDWIVSTNWTTYASKIVKANYTIIYESSDNAVITPNTDTDFGASIETNTYSNNIGFMIFNGPITSIDDNGFNGKTNLVSIIIPDSVTQLGGSSFEGCIGLTEFIIPDNTVHIGGYSFRGCSELTKIVIGSGVSSIDERAFYECSKLKTIICKATNPPTLSSEVFLYNAENRLIYVPDNAVNTYKSATNWSIYADYIRPISELTIE